ncbi:flavodoxin domain-containing protein [Cryobacterium sp. SO2]|uniref:flavodoxin family protein n=1 Tax=Cryobacterium sp. SO2 TaxID=1897060 RepID=UPI00223E2936|nr:flavodoxin domain-containing protein [Cryobacterium sp. SO2]WEO78794.1 flavodoxin domain-containing protein [Cryobacterium sp. SO2]
MNVLIVIESCFGNTAQVAGAVATGLRSRGADVTVVDAASADAPAAEGVDLLLLGAPTHNMGLPGPASRAQAAAKGGHPVSSGIAEWLELLPGQAGRRVATFDTVAGRGFFSGSAAKAIEKRLRRHSATVAGRESFLVGGTAGPLADGELARAELWGAALAS